MDPTTSHHDLSMLQTPGPTTSVLKQKRPIQDKGAHDIIGVKNRRVGDEVRSPDCWCMYRSPNLQALSAIPRSAPCSRRQLSLPGPDSQDTGLCECTGLHSCMHLS